MPDRFAAAARFQLGVSARSFDSATASTSARRFGFDSGSASSTGFARPASRLDGFFFELCRRSATAFFDELRDLDLQASAAASSATSTGFGSAGVLDSFGGGSASTGSTASSASAAASSFLAALMTLIARFGATSVFGKYLKRTFSASSTTDRI